MVTGPNVMVFALDFSGGRRYPQSAGLPGIGKERYGPG